MKLLTKDEAAKRLNISVNTLDRAVAAGEIRAIRILGSVRFNPAWLEQDLLKLTSS